MNTYFLCATQPTNVGDLVINKMLIDELCHYGEVHVDCSSDLSDDFRRPLLQDPNSYDLLAEEGFSVKKASVKNVFLFLKFIKQKRINLITISPGPMGTYGKKVRLGLILINVAARMSGAKVLYYGKCVSRCISTNKPIKTVFANSIYFRSSESVKYASNYLHNVHYIPDLAFLLYPYKYYSKSRTVIIDYRPSMENDSTIEDLSKIINIFLGNGFKVEFYYQVKGDKQFVNKIFRQLYRAGVSIRENLVWYNDLDYYEDKAFVVSNRLHSLLFGAIYGAIPIARISIDPMVMKIKHVFEDSLPQIFSQNIFSGCDPHINYLIENEDMLRNEVLSAVERNCDKCKKIIRESLMMSPMNPMR